MIVGITWWSLKKDSLLRFWVIEWRSWPLCPLKSMVISIFLNIGMVKFLKILHTVFIVSKQIIQIKILNEINFFLIITYILLQFKVLVYSPKNVLGLLTYINALPVVYWPPQCIAIDHSSIGLQRLTKQPMFNEAQLCVWKRILRHNTSLVCTATLSIILNNPCHTSNSQSALSVTDEDTERIQKIHYNFSLVDIFFDHVFHQWAPPQAYAPINIAGYQLSLTTIPCRILSALSQKMVRIIL